MVSNAVMNAGLIPRRVRNSQSPARSFASLEQQKFPGGRFGDDCGLRD